MAKSLNTCVISADSRQFYKELNIGTAKPTKDEMQGIKHYFIGNVSIQSDLSAARFEKEVLQVLEQEFKKNDFVILTGGSGLFIDAVCKGLDDIPFSQAVRDNLNQEFSNNGLQPLLEELKKKDLAFYKFVDRQNPMRVIRALEVIRNTGKPISDLQNKQVKVRPFISHQFVIDHDRELLYQRINERVEKMMDQGLLEEVKSLTEFKDRNALKTVGYKELFDYLDNLCTLDEAVEAIKQNTRRYAKRQLTWFRRNPEAIWIKYADNQSMISNIKNAIDLVNADSE